MTRYTIVPRRTWLWFVAVCAVLGVLFLMTSLYVLIGPIEERGEFRDPTGAERVYGYVDGLIGVWMFVCVIMAVRTPYAIEIGPGVSIAFVTLFGRRTVPVREIRALEWQRDRQLLTVNHGKRRTTLGPFNQAAEFVSDVRWLHPTVVVTVTESTGPGASK